MPFSIYERMIDAGGWIKRTPVLIDYKTANEVDAIRLRPHPYEFMLYYDI